MRRTVILFTQIVVFFCYVFILYKCKYKLLGYSSVAVFKKKRYKWYQRKYIFSCPIALSTSSKRYIWGKEALINIDDSKYHPNLQLNIVILKHFVYYKIFCEMFFTNYSHGSFLYCQNFFILKVLIHLLLRKWNKTWIFFMKKFVSFIKLFNIGLDEYSRFLSRVK